MEILGNFDFNFYIFKTNFLFHPVLLLGLNLFAFGYFLAIGMFTLKRSIAPVLITQIILPVRRGRYNLKNPDFATPLVK